MGLLDIFRGAPSASAHLLVHLPSLSDAKKGAARLSPGDIIQQMNRLSSFSKREELQISAIVDGKPLRDVEDRKPFKGIMTFFVESESNINSVLNDAVRHVRQGGRGVLVTSNAQYEKSAEALGIEMIKAATLLKGIDTSFDEGGKGGSRSGRSSDGRRRSRGGRGGRDKRSEGGKASSRKPQEKKEKPSRDDPVSQLIDVVE